jgi:hypothetical protein
MKSANVTFSRVAGVVEMTLEIDGQRIASSTSQESIALELQIHEVGHLSIEGKFSTDLPTSAETLAQASEVAFSELMPALRLVAACSTTGLASHSLLPKKARKRAVVDAKPAKTGKHANH